MKQRKSDSKWVDTGKYHILIAEFAEIDATDINRVFDQTLGCRAFFTTPDNFALMYTLFNPERRDGDGNIAAGESFQQIQICPFFLLWALPLKTNLNTVLLPKILWRKMTIGLVQKLVTATKFTPIDAVSLFDKVLLHEVFDTSSGSLL